MDKDAILKQSESAYKQWAEQWREHAIHHSQYEQKSILDFENIGVGKACVVVANGYSLEENIETLKANQDNVDILCCDKTLGHLLDNGIIPDYCLVCDANVSAEYFEPWKDKLKHTVLFMNVCANPEWSIEGNWKDRYWFVNKDIMKNEIEFCNLSKCPNIIPAGTNVSNAMLVFLTQSDDKGYSNYFGYDKYILLGFDYSWTHETGYYAFDYKGGGKRNYMKHIYCMDTKGREVQTSNNLAFSASWLDKYISTFAHKVVNGSDRSIMSTAPYRELEGQLQYKYKTEDRDTVRRSIEVRNQLTKQIGLLDKKLKQINKDHHYHFVGSV